MELQDFLIHARVFKLYRQATNVVSWLNEFTLRSLRQSLARDLRYFGLATAG
ncbi:hypothetical protein RYX36_025479, partial [Vicia faba]